MEVQACRKVMVGKLFISLEEGILSKYIECTFWMNHMRK